MAIATNHLAGIVRFDRGIAFTARTMIQGDNDNRQERHRDAARQQPLSSAAFAQGAMAARAWMAAFGMASASGSAWHAPLDAVGTVNRATIANLWACNAMTQDMCSIAHRHWLDAATRFARLADPFALNAARERND